MRSLWLPSRSVAIRLAHHQMRPVPAARIEPLRRLCTSQSHPEPPAASCPPTRPPTVSTDRKMGAWQVHAYGDVDELQFSDRVKIPTIREANDVLVRVRAASLNAIDLEMTRGFGAATFNWMRRCSEQNIEFPLTLGRDFCGEVVHRGMGVRADVRVGQRVWGTVPFNRSGSHAEYTAVDACQISAAPGNVDDTHAAACLYAGLTAWSGLFLSGQLGGLAGATSSLGGGQGKRVCILGASGGVGHLAVQMCSAEGADVVATCSADAVPLVEAAGCATVIDYRLPEAGALLAANGPYDIVLDCAGKGADYAAEVDWRFAHYVTFTSPLLGNNDAYGLIGGSVRNVAQLLVANLRSVTRNGGGGLVKWAYVAALPHGVEYLRRLVEQGKIVPVVEKTYGFAEADAAYRRLAEGHLRGKIVLKM